MKKNKNLLFVALFFIVNYFIFFSLLQTAKEARVDLALQSHTKKLQTFYEILQHNQKITADITYEETMENGEFLEIFQKANSAKEKNQKKELDTLREQAYELLEDKYLLYSKKGVLQYHFVFPDNKAFLRMHKPSRYNDDLSLVRKDFVYTNLEKEIVRGFSQGRTTHAFRNVYPIIDQNKRHLGAVEISFSSDLLQDYFTNVNKIHTHFLVRKDIFNVKAWDRKDLILKYLQSAEHPSFLITMTSQHTKQVCIIDNSEIMTNIKRDIISKMDHGDPFSIFNIHEKKARVLSFFPIVHNITEEKLAWIVSYRDDQLIDQTLLNFRYFYIILFFVVGMLSLMLYYFLNQKKILKALVEERTLNLQKAYRELEEQEHEMELLNENLEKKVIEEVEKNRQKDRVLFEQTKMAALGEMIGNIAHQWRQPLSVISTGVSGMQVLKEIDALSDQKFEEICETISENTQYLSKTIDDFKRFVQGGRQKGIFNLKSSIDTFVNLVNSSIKKYGIIIELHVADDFEINGYENELNQCFINLFNNSKDAMASNEVKYIYLSAKVQEDSLQIIFHDNGGGIYEEIIHKVFEPYFTTKHQAQGTGLGLNITYRLVVEGMSGTISVMNENVTYKDKEYRGAKFIIKLPL